VKSRVAALIPLILLSAATASAQLVGPAAQCVDTVSKEGNTLAGELMKAANDCEKKKEDGAYPLDSNCRSNFVMVDSSIQPAFAERVQAARAKLTAKVETACAGVVVEAGFDLPCGTFEGVEYAQDLARCVLYDGHGRAVSRLQAIVHVNVQPPRNKCREGLAKGAANYLKKSLVAFRKCGRALAAGKACDADLIADKLARARAAAERAMLAACREREQLRLGGYCYGQYDASELEVAVDCVADRTESESTYLAKMLYDLPFLPE